ncbi:MAG: CRISPR system precrRNA processing endoribonuclease RAMP protein Cas6 [Anaerolineae bacterium]|nr:CRISPR system precrRNA processing endoribonuclease RAMP protein Cas6 [Anaerolineae bacterium]MDW8170922.1 CRISPR system precrRNA processing endoribonuclease RAMP protein Cas6 [Anaerolineae bacterium]
MIPITSLTVTLNSRYPLDLGGHSGASLRGALYEALAVMYDSGAQPQLADMDSNPTAWLMRLEAETNSGKDVPRPFAIRPPLGLPSTETRFGMSFYGRAAQLIPLVLSAWQGVQTIGLGRNRQKVTLKAVEGFDLLTRQSYSLEAGLPTPTRHEDYQHFATLLHPQRLQMRFLTPTRIIHQEHLCHEPQFRPWFQRLLERLRLLSELYAEPLWIPFADLLAAADEVRLVRDRTHWQEGWTHNRREGMRRPMGGFVGEAHYEGDLRTLLPYVLLGQAVQVGKNTVKGSGWYEVVYQIA